MLASVLAAYPALGLGAVVVGVDSGGVNDGGKWHEGAVLSVAIGQESTQASPLQLANYIATLVNGGLRRHPAQVRAAAAVFHRDCHGPEIVETIDIKPENLEAVKAGMLSLTQSGSVAKYFRDLGIKVGAKTGCALADAALAADHRDHMLDAGLGVGGGA